ncbi:MAG: acyl-CoA thioester hydrolase/BAAT C-terminal domain-containing protein [Alphaproteobacteria bacterium]
MLIADPIDAVHDVPLRITNGGASPLRCDVEWIAAWGGRCAGSVMVSPGEHNAEDLGLFYNLALTYRPEILPTGAVWIAPVELRLSGGPTLTRRTMPESTRVDFVEDDGLKALLFTPEDARRDIAIITLQGSGGGYLTAPAGALSGHRFISLALAWYAVPGLPADLVRIPIEYVERAINWLYARTQVKKIVLLGTSKGGELALLCGAYFPSVRAVIAYVPSGQTLPWRTEELGQVACWTYRDKDLPWTAMDYSRNPPPREGRFIIRPGYESTLDDPAEIERTAIPIERTNGPILMISGGQDAMWPSSVFSQLALERAKRLGFAHEITHLDYPEAGHAIGIPNQPRVPGKGDVFELGGTPRDNALGSRDSWVKVLAFLDRL